MIGDWYCVWVAGTRIFDRYKLLAYKLDNFFRAKMPKVMILTGGQQKLSITPKVAEALGNILQAEVVGADYMAERYADERGLPKLVIPARWSDLEQEGAVIKTRQDGTEYNANAGPYRNRQLCELADALVAFWNGHSTGTQHALSLAKEKGIPTRVVSF